MDSENNIFQRFVFLCLNLMESFLEGALLRFSPVSRVNHSQPCATSRWPFCKCQLPQAPFVTCKNLGTQDPYFRASLVSVVASLHLLIVSGHVFPGFVGSCATKIITVIACLSTTLQITLDVVLAGQFQPQKYVSSTYAIGSSQDSHPKRPCSSIMLVSGTVIASLHF